MNSSRKLLCSSLLALSTVYAVYAPIPEQEQGKAWSATARASFGSDSNLFGGATDETDSLFASASAKLSFNASLTDQTFGSAFLQSTLDHFYSRPGEKDLTSHDLFARLAHSFSAATTIDFIDFFQISKNPESLLAGLPLNTDQSFKRNQLDFSYSTALTEKISASIKLRNVYFAYDDAVLGSSLDRIENLCGLAGTYGILPETKAVLEYRHLDIAYDSDGAIKDKKSDFLLTGVDYKPSAKVTLSARIGAEWRSRKSEASSTSPSMELSYKYDYAAQSFFSAGYAYAIEEASNVGLYTDTKVNRAFLNFQHSLSPVLLGSASLTYEPSTLQGRLGIPDISERTFRFGVALNYVMDKNWSLCMTYDWDNVSSDDAARKMERHRFTVMANYAF